MLLFASGVSLLFAHVFFGNLWLLEQVYNFRQLRNRKLTYKERVKCYCNIVVHFLHYFRHQVHLEELYRIFMVFPIIY
jgi:hypothetical protein